MSKLSRAVAETWEDPEVAKARSKRWRCIVARGGVEVEFKTTKEAYRFVYGNDTHQRHIKFRTELVKVGSFERDGYSWAVVPK